MSTMRDKTGLSKRMEASKAYKPGILKKEDGKWVLYKAERYLLAVEGKYENSYLKNSSYVIVKNMETEDSEQKKCRIVENKDEAEFRFGDFVDFTVVKDESGRKVTNGNKNFLIWDGIIESMQMHQDSETEMLSGYVYVGEPFKRKRGESVFYDSGEKVSVASEKLEEAYQRMSEVLKIYRDTAINRSEGHSGYGDFERAEKQEIIPLWYQPIGKKNVDLSLAAIGRIFYGKNLNTLVGEKSPCKDRGHLCKACALFGMTGNESVGSRVRFTDAKLTGDFDDKKDITKETLKILGEPRYSYLPFYAKGSDEEIPESYDTDGVEIMGRKFYWHNMDVNNDSEIYTSQVKNEMNSTVTLLMPEKEFAFDVHYDGVTETQLKQLIWCLCIGENTNNSEAKMYHKMGHGKPLGLGSVKIVVENKLERIFENNHYSWEEVQGEEIAKYIEEGVQLQNKKALMKVLNKNEPGESQKENLPIEYPDIRKATGEKYTEEERTNNNKLARHLWYAKNKEPGNEDRKALPNIMEEKQGLCAYQKKESEITASEGIKAIYNATVYKCGAGYVKIKLEDGTFGSISCRDIKGNPYGRLSELYKKGDKLRVSFKRQNENYKYYKIV